MTDKRKVIVKINGQSFTVVGNESEKYIKYIAEFVDSKINDILSNNKRLGQSAASVLAAFNIVNPIFNHSYSIYSQSKCFKFTRKPSIKGYVRHFLYNRGYSVENPHISSTNQSNETKSASTANCFSW